MAGEVTHEAIMFLDGGKVIKEMLYSEFEAILDGVVGLTDLADKQGRAVFLQLDSDHSIVGAVFFLVDFDSGGGVPESWNIPLRQLIDQAKGSVRFGGSSVRIATSVNCPVALFRKQLWDPSEGQTAAEPNSWPATAAIIRAISSNSLGLVRGERPSTNEIDISGAAETSQYAAAPTAENSADIQNKYKERLQKLTTEHKLKQVALQSRYQERFSQQEAQFKEKMQAAAARLKNFKQIITAERERSKKLKLRLEEAAAQAAKSREQLEKTLSEKGGNVSEQQLAALRAEFDKQLKEQLEHQSMELEERLEMREAELNYRDETLADLRTSLSNLRREHQQLQSSGGDQLLQRMIEHEINFVALHPGIEQLAITITEMPDYLENPEAFVAAKCGVTVEEYQRWLAHYRLPTCRAVKPDGSFCGNSVDRVDDPGEFRAGGSDRCAEHLT